jgi:GDP-D-mannose dehydratase
VVEFDTQWTGTQMDNAATLARDLSIAIGEADVAFRPHRFVKKKIVKGAFRIKAGQQQKLRFGKLTIQRDWGWAAGYVETMWRMLQLSKAEDFIIATGVSHSLEDCVDAAGLTIVTVAPDDSPCEACRVTAKNRSFPK